MASLKTKVISLIALTYSINSIAGVTVISDDELHDYANNNAIESIATELAVTNHSPILSSSLSNGASIEWKSNNKFEVYGSKMPIGFNDSGLIVKSFISKDNSFGKIDSSDITIPSIDIPMWILSKYSNVSDVKNGLKNINIIKGKNDLSLSYRIIDKNNNEIIVSIKDGDVSFH